MVKILVPPVYYLPGDWFSVVSHIGGIWWLDPHVYHCIWHYQLTDIPVTSAGGYKCQDELTARLCAAHWAAEPMIPRFICLACRNNAPGPTAPRYNIYRGPNHIFVPPTFLWDIYNGPPPGHP